MEYPHVPCEIAASLLTRVKQNVPRYYLEAASEAEQDAVFRGLFLGGVGPSGSDPPSDESSAEDRYDRSFVVAEALRQELAARYTFDPPGLSILLDPSGMRCEDAVYMAYFYTPDPLDLGQAVLLHLEAMPAGQRFATEDALATYLAEQYAQLERGYASAVPRPVPAIPFTS